MVVCINSGERDRNERPEQVVPDERLPKQMPNFGRRRCDQGQDDTGRITLNSPQPSTTGGIQQVVGNGQEAIGETGVQSAE